MTIIGFADDFVTCDVFRDFADVFRDFAAVFRDFADVFRDFTQPYLPQEVLFRQKEQFSDGVGYDWIDGLKAHAAKVDLCPWLSLRMSKQCHVAALVWCLGILDHARAIVCIYKYAYASEGEFAVKTF